LGILFLPEAFFFLIKKKQKIKSQLTIKLGVVTIAPDNKFPLMPNFL
jgi:hypothetical protein